MMKLFCREHPVVGMVHLLPLPGSPQFASTDRVLIRAQEDFHALRDGGVDGILIENFGDVPYFKDDAESHTIAWMTKVILSLNCDLPFGVNVLRNDCGTALAIADATGGQFIRCNVLSGAMVTDQGIIEGKAADILRYRMKLHADVKIFADVHVKYATPLKESSIAFAARDAVYRGLADAVIVTGSETGAPPSLQDLEAVKKTVFDTFLFAGSGCTPENVESILKYADGCIVGKGFKKHVKIENPVDRKRVATFMEIVETLR